MVLFKGHFIKNSPAFGKILRTQMKKLPQTFDGQGLGKVSAFKHFRF